MAGKKKKARIIEPDEIAKEKEKAEAKSKAKAKLIKELEALKEKGKSFKFGIHPKRSNMAGRVIMISQNIGKRLYKGKLYEFPVTDELIKAIDQEIIMRIES